MIFKPKNIFYNIFFNATLFIFLIISIQNSNEKNKVKFMLNETIELPNSFIIGVSFISGSLFSGFLLDNENPENK